MNSSKKVGLSLNNISIKLKNGCKKNAITKACKIDFIVSCGVKAHVIKNYFANYEILNKDFSINMRNNDIEYHSTHNVKNWKISWKSKENFRIGHTVFFMIKSPLPLM